MHGKSGTYGAFSYGCACDYFCEGKHKRIEKLSNLMNAASEDHISHDKK